VKVSIKVMCHDQLSLCLCPFLVKSMRAQRHKHCSAYGQQN